MRRRWKAAAARLALIAAALLCVSGIAAAQTGVELLSGVGYHSTGTGPSFLLGAELATTSRTGNFFSGYQESRLALHLSDVFSFDGSASTYTVGVEGTWERRQGPVQLATEANLHFRYGASGWARSFGLGGGGATGRVRGAFRLDYVESVDSVFPWFQKDLNGVAPQGEDKPFYRATANLSALILPAYNLTWSQEIRWRRAVDDRSGNLAMTTGPEFLVGVGRLAAQAGIMLSPDGIKPMGQIRYDLREPTSRVNFQVTAATASLESDGPVVYGWLDFESEGLGFATAVRLERSASGSLSPAVYFSIQPKF